MWSDNYIVRLNGVVIVASNIIAGRTNWLSWGGELEIPYSIVSFWRPLSILYFHSLLLPFLFIFLCLRCVLLSLVLCVTYEIYSEGGPSMYIYCMVCYCVIAAPCIRSVSCVCAYFYTFDDNLQCHALWTIFSPKVFSFAGWWTFRYFLIIHLLFMANITVL